MKALAESEIVYRDFWDVPRIFIVRHDSQHYLFDCQFDESAEDFAEEYLVYAFPELPDDVLTESWVGYSARATSFLGRVQLRDVVFDPSRRRSIDTAIVDKLLRKRRG